MIGTEQGDCAYDRDGSATAATTPQEGGVRERVRLIVGEPPDGTDDALIERVAKGWDQGHYLRQTREPCTCDPNPETTQGIEEDCPRHGIDRETLRWLHAVSVCSVATVDELMAHLNRAPAATQAEGEAASCHQCRYTGALVSRSDESDPVCPRCGEAVPLSLLALRAAAPAAPAAPGDLGTGEHADGTPVHDPSVVSDRDAGRIVENLCAEYGVEPGELVDAVNRDRIAAIALYTDAWIGPGRPCRRCQAARETISGDEARRLWPGSLIEVEGHSGAYRWRVAGGWRDLDGPIELGRCSYVVHHRAPASGEPS